MKRLRTVQVQVYERKDERARGQALIRETQEKQQRQCKYADWQWSQARQLWWLVTQDNAWAHLPCEVRYAILQQLVPLVFERSISRRIRIPPLEPWFWDGKWDPHCFVQQYDAFRHDALVAPFILAGDMQARELQYQLVTNGEPSVTNVSAWHPIDTVEQFIACLEASRHTNARILFQYNLIATLPAEFSAQ